MVFVDGGAVVVVVVGGGDVVVVVVEGGAVVVVGGVVVVVGNVEPPPPSVPPPPPSAAPPVAVAVVVVVTVVGSVGVAVVETLSQRFTSPENWLLLDSDARVKTTSVRTAIESLPPNPEAEASMFTIAKRTHDDTANVRILGILRWVFAKKKFLYEPLFTCQSSQAHNTPPPTNSQHWLKSDRLLHE